MVPHFVTVLLAPGPAAVAMVAVGLVVKSRQRAADRDSRRSEPPPPEPPPQGRG